MAAVGKKLGRVVAGFLPTRIERSYRLDNSSARGHAEQFRVRPGLEQNQAVAAPRAGGAAPRSVTHRLGRSVEADRLEFSTGEEGYKATVGRPECGIHQLGAR